MLAFTRAVSPRLAACELTHLARTPIDADRAAAEHAAYEAALRDAGLTVRRLPPLPDAPDGVFVEDTAVWLDEIAIVTRPGTPARAGECASTQAALATVAEVRTLPAGRLDGGDVLRVGRLLLCGLSARTDAAGAAALADAAAPFGYRLATLPVSFCLHLKTGVTLAGSDAEGRPVFVVNPAWVSVAALTALVPGARCLEVDPGEAFGANVLRVGGTLLMAAGNPRIEAALRALFPDLRVLGIGELQRAEAGLTCLSLIGPSSAPS